MTGMRSLFVLAMLSAPVAAAADNEARQVTPELRQRAEDLAGAASQRFTDILGGKRQEVAQSAATPGGTDTPPPAGTFAPVWDWLARSSQAYDDIVITQLKNPDGWTVIVQRAGDAAPAPAPALPAAQEEPPPELRGWSGLVEMMRDWLARANRSYRNEIVKPLLEPTQPGTPGEVVQQPVKSGEEIKREAEAADAKRAADEAEARRRSLQAKRTAEEDEAKRKAGVTAPAKGDVGRIESRRAADAETKRAADEAESKRRTEAQAADAERRADEEKRRADAAEAKHRAQAEARARLVEEAAEAQTQGGRRGQTRRRRRGGQTQSRRS